MLAFIIVPATFVGFVGFGLVKTSPPRDLVNEPGPQFSLPLLQGGRLTSADLRSKPVVINFWASWCTPCREEAKVLEEKWRTYGERGVVIVGVNVQDSAEDAARFVDEFGLTFPIVRDVDLILYRKLGVRGMPETFFLDHTYRFSAIESGRQLGERGGTKVLGAIEPGLLEAQIQQLLAKREGQNDNEHGPSTSSF